MQFALDKITLGDEILRGKVRGNINRPFIIIMEYLPGFNMVNIAGDRCFTIFHPDALKHSTANQGVMGLSKGPSSTVGDSPLIQLGKILASDLILHNKDRIGLIGKGKGNLENIHFEVAPTKQIM